MDDRNVEVVKYFTRGEVACRHCGALPELSRDARRFWEAVSTLRAGTGSPLTLTSGYRCPQHPLSLARARAGLRPSAHELLLAADLQSKRYTPTELFWLARLQPVFHGFGISIEKNFLHVDARPERRSIWTYRKGQSVTLV